MKKIILDKFQFLYGAIGILTVPIRFRRYLCFNSYMVQLGFVNAHDEYIVAARFQFLYGAIGMKTSSNLRLQHPYFNSYIVQFVLYL